MNTKSRLAELLNTSFGGYYFERVDVLDDDFYSMTDDENTIVLRINVTNNNWYVWIDDSLCLEAPLNECLDWIGALA